MFYEDEKNEKKRRCGFEHRFILFIKNGNEGEKNYENVHLLICDPIDNFHGAV